jgi:hypothetical protein
MNNILTLPVVPELPLKELCGLTQSQFTRFDRACNATYQSIGHDFQDGGRSRATQIEVICDAGYIRMYGEYNHRKPKEGVQPFIEFYDKVVEPMITNHYGTPVFKKMMKIVFPHARYE